MKKILPILLLAFLTSHAFTETPPTVPGYKSHTLQNAQNLLQQKFLPDARAWERADIWIPQNKNARGKKLPCIIVFYGGNYTGKAVNRLAKDLQAFVDAGYVVVMPDYAIPALPPEPQVVWDGQAAIHFVRNNAEKFHIDPERIGAIGYSAGGWLLQKLAPADHSCLIPVKQNDITTSFPLLKGPTARTRHHIFRR